MPELNASEWNDFLARYPDAHLLQTAAWGALKAEFGWDVNRVVAGDVGAQVLFRPLPLGFTLAYIPKGPVGGSLEIMQLEGNSRSDCEQNSWSKLWPAIDELCRSRKSILLKVEPDLWEFMPSKGKNGSQKFYPPGFRLGSHNVQPKRTLVVDINGDEEKILSQMKQKTRYNIRLALRKGVVVRVSSDLDIFHRLMTETGSRDAFGVHSLDYYRRAYELFHPRGECELLLAEFKGEPLAALMVFLHGSRAWYFYGASANQHRERMPTYILQWEAMRWAKEHGCTQYDLWGVPDAKENTLEANFTKRSDGLWGVYRFKRGFGGQLFRAAGPWDRIYKPLPYAFYNWWTSRRKFED